jgi:hypothetical protein
MCPLITAVSPFATRIETMYTRSNTMSRLTNVRVAPKASDFA